MVAITGSKAMVWMSGRVHVKIWFTLAEWEGGASEKAKCLFLIAPPCRMQAP